MQRVVHRADTRGKTVTDWLDSSHTFSFNEYWEGSRIHFGALRVLNDDYVKASTGFGRHPHNNMEIVSIPLKGELTHADSTGEVKRTIRYGEIQTMSAGAGIFHSEMNNSEKEELNFLQIWIIPRRDGFKPEYHDHQITKLFERNKLKTIVSPNGDVGAKLNQSAWFSLGDFDSGIEFVYKVHKREKQGVYFFIIEGEVEIDGEVLNARDGFGISGVNSVHLKAIKDSKILSIEIPMNFQ